MPRLVWPRIALACCVLALLADPAAAEVNLRTDLDLGELAECIADSGAVFYGAHWCPFCRKQNAYFGEHASALPYFECYDGPRSEGKNEACEDAGVRGFPTWVFADGSTRGGALSPAKLALATGCL